MGYRLCLILEKEHITLYIYIYWIRSGAGYAKLDMLIKHLKHSSTSVIRLDMNW